MAEWLRVLLRCPPSEKEAAWALLYRFDCIGLEETDPESCCAYFPAGADPAPILAALSSASWVHHLEASIVAAQNWHARWLDSYRSFRVGRFFIRPSWRQERPEPGTIEIVMDPKGAFGTGVHATTQLSLKALPGLVQGRRSMADVGCGSGILSIAARKISSSSMKVVALDNDPEAIAVCRGNAAINNVTFDILCGTLAASRHRVDLIVANLQLDTLVRLTPEFCDRTEPAATLLLSGVLADQVSEVRAVYEPVFELQSLGFQDEWAARVYRRK